MSTDEVLDHIYDHMDDEWGITQYDALNGSPVEVYITNPDGECYQIVAIPHSHSPQRL